MAQRPALAGLPMPSMRRAADLLRVIGHPVRLKLIELLVQRPHTVGDLARLVDRQPHAVSQHLSLMAGRGLLDRRREGRRVYYRVTHAGVLGVWRAIHNYEHIHASFQDGEAI